MTIKGTIKYQSISTGFWGLLDEDGQRWRPVNLPPNLQEEGFKVEVKAKKVRETVSIFMWGTPIEIIEFKKV